MMLNLGGEGRWGIVLLCVVLFFVFIIVVKVGSVCVFSSCRSLLKVLKVVKM